MCYGKISICKIILLSLLCSMTIHAEANSLDRVVIPDNPSAEECEEFSEELKEIVDATILSHNQCLKSSGVDFNTSNEQGFINGQNSRCSKARCQSLHELRDQQLGERKELVQKCNVSARERAKRMEVVYGSVATRDSDIKEHLTETGNSVSNRIAENFLRAHGGEEFLDAIKVANLVSQCNNEGIENQKKCLGGVQLFTQNLRGNLGHGAVIVEIQNAASNNISSHFEVLIEDVDGLVKSLNEFGNGDNASGVKKKRKHTYIEPVIEN